MARRGDGPGRLGWWLWRGKTRRGAEGWETAGTSFSNPSKGAAVGLLCAFLAVSVAFDSLGAEGAGNALTGLCLI